MLWFKSFHIVGIILWMGGLLDLTRILGYHVAEEIPVQQRLARMEFRMFWFVATPGMAIAVIMGLFLFFYGGGPQVYFAASMKWFHIKVLMVLALIVVHFLFGKMMMNLRANPQKIRPVRFKILHGITGLLLILTVIFVVVKPFS